MEMTIIPTEMRMNKHYVFWYRNVIQLLVLGESSNLDESVYWRLLEALLILKNCNPSCFFLTFGIPYVGLIPLVAIVYFNLQVLAVIRRQRRLDGRLTNTRSLNLKKEARRQAYVLFCVCGTMGVCHLPRLILNIQEFINLETFKEVKQRFLFEKRDCISRLNFAYTVNFPAIMADQNHNNNRDSPYLFYWSKLIYCIS